MPDRKCCVGKLCCWDKENATIVHGWVRSTPSGLTYISSHLKVNVRATFHINETITQLQDIWFINKYFSENQLKTSKITKFRKKNSIIKKYSINVFKLCIARQKERLHYFYNFWVQKLPSSNFITKNLKDFASLL